MRSIGMDVHRSFAQVAVLDRGKVTEEFRVELDYDAVVAFGQKLRKDDEVGHLYLPAAVELVGV